MKKYDNLIFDFGGVLLDLAVSRCKEMFHALGFNEIDNLLGTAHQKGILDRFERGLITGPEFYDSLRSLIAGSGKSADAITDAQIWEAWVSMAEALPAYRLAEIAKLKREGYHVSALSNTNCIHWEYCRHFFVDAGFPPEELFENIWLSYELHLAKPDVTIFKKVLEVSGYNPGRTLFIDDAPRNCQAAQACGIATFNPQPRTDWRQDLNAVLT